MSPRPPLLPRGDVTDLIVPRQPAVTRQTRDLGSPIPLARGHFNTLWRDGYGRRGFASARPPAAMLGDHVTQVRWPGPVGERAFGRSRIWHVGSADKLRGLRFADRWAGSRSSLESRVVSGRLVVLAQELVVCLGVEAGRACLGRGLALVDVATVAATPLDDLVLLKDLALADVLE